MSSIQQIINYERDMLNRNLNRMCVTNSKEELEWCYKYAIGHIEKIMNLIEIEQLKEK